MATIVNLYSVRTITEDGELVSLVEGLEDHEANELFADTEKNIEAGMIVQLISEDDDYVVSEKAA